MRERMWGGARKRLAFEKMRERGGKFNLTSIGALRHFPQRGKHEKGYAPHRSALSPKGKHEKGYVPHRSALSPKGKYEKGYDFHRSPFGDSPRL